ncbi:MAG: hypothetical protein HRU19_14625 [Pseudobacteriovorax sp.]|nr:hypothetical protein [Pseudobacteriovorax sp.]
MAGKYGIVTSEIPLVSVPFDQSSEVGNTINTLTVETTTPVIVLTKNRFIFGDLDAFTTNIDSLRNKFSVSHVDGAPDLLNLIKDIEKWLFGRASRSNISSQGLGILIPQGEIPTPIVIQTIQSLKASKHFEKIVLGSGFQ